MSTPLSRDNNVYRDKMKAAFNRFRVKERHYLLSLPKAVKRKLKPNAPHWYFAAHVSYYCEVLFTLGGIKPCVLFVHGADQEFTDNLIETCLKPVLEEYNIMAYGFSLTRILHDLPTSAHKGFKNGWVLADLCNPRYPIVERVFLRPYGGRVPEVEVGNALGYPTVRGNHLVEYLDDTEREPLARVAQVPDICCVTAMEYTTEGNLDNLQRVTPHFRKCANLMQLVGRTLKITTRG
ncbi:hypothetical protein PM082_021491 [Marasmius tenuissimus]|nr:hypothetical protein PM082_021491 [Marasmius tenuissimus]